MCPLWYSARCRPDAQFSIARHPPVAWWFRGSAHPAVPVDRAENELRLVFGKRGVDGVFHVSHHRHAVHGAHIRSSVFRSLPACGDAALTFDGSINARISNECCPLEYSPFFRQSLVALCMPENRSAFGMLSISGRGLSDASRKPCPKYSWTFSLSAWNHASIA